MQNLWTSRYFRGSLAAVVVFLADWIILELIESAFDIDVPVLILLAMIPAGLIYYFILKRFRY